MINQKDFGLVIAIGVLVFLAVFSPKKVLVAEGFALTRAELDEGGRIYREYCASCHQSGQDGAPATGDVRRWKQPIGKGVQQLILHAFGGFRGERGVMHPNGEHASLDLREVTLATGWMIERSTPPKD